MAELPRVFFAASARRETEFRAVKKQCSDRYLRKTNATAFRAFGAAVTPIPEQNVVGVGIGEKITAGRPTGIQAVKFLVRRKYPEGEIAARHRLPKVINGLPVDVEESGLLRRFGPAPPPRRRGGPIVALPNPRVRIRPAQPGCSVGFRDAGSPFVMAGTFGALVRDDNGIYILSNNHVLANEDQMPIGAPIFQPGLLDGGRPAADRIAELTRFIPMQTGDPLTVDAAIARVLDPATVSRDVLHIGAPQGTGRARDDVMVHKFGRTTSYRAGRVASVDTDVDVGYDTGTFLFTDQIVIVGLNGESFSDSGDSGSLILERGTQTAVGLLFGGSPSHTLANHIDDVLNALGVALA